MSNSILPPYLLNRQISRINENITEIVPAVQKFSAIFKYFEIDLKYGK